MVGIAAGKTAERLVVLCALAATVALCVEAWQGRASAMRLATERGGDLLQLVEARIGSVARDARNAAAHALYHTPAVGPAAPAAAPSGSATLPSFGPSVRAVLLVNRNGVLVGQLGPEAGGDRPVLPAAWINQLHRPAAGAGVEVLGVLGAGSAGARVAMGVHAPGRDGVFNGAAIALVDPFAVSNTLKDAHPGPGGIISVQSGSGELLFRWPSPERFIGTHATTGGGERATTGAGERADAAGRQYAVVLTRSDAALDLSATVALAGPDILDDWKSRLRWQVIMFMLVLALAGFAISACRAAQRRQRQVQLLQDALEAGDDARIVWDGAGRLLLASRQAAALLGLAPGQLATGSARAGLVAALAPGRIHDTGHGDAAAAAGLAGSYRIGDARRIHVEEAPLDGGRTLTRLCDVTDACLRQERRVASARIEAMAELAARLGHDFNNVLTVTLGHMDLLKRTLPEGSRHATLAASAMAGAKRGAELVSRLMGFGVTQPGDYKPARLSVLLDDVAQLAQAGLGETLALDIANAVPDTEVLCDGAELKDAVLNLVLNARDAMPEGGWISVRVESEQVREARTTRSGLRLEPGRYARIDVSDQGQGIPGEAWDRMFEPYFTTRKKARGAGLGLPIVYGFCRRHRGAVEATALPGSGTTFSLYLPAMHPGAH